MKNRIILFLIMFLLFSINEIYAQKGQDEIDEIVVSSRPAKKLLLNKIYVINGLLIKDSVIANKLIAESINLKTKTKLKELPQNIAKSLNLDTEKYSYFIELIEIKDVIIDSETMELIKIK